MAGRRSTHPQPNHWDTAVRVTTARVECTVCGPIIVRFDDVELVAARETIWYQFTCRICGNANTVTTAPYATDLLVTSGVRIRLIGRPSEASEPHPRNVWTPREIDTLLAQIDSLDPGEPDADATTPRDPTPKPGGNWPGPTRRAGSDQRSGTERGQADRQPGTP